LNVNPDIEARLIALAQSSDISVEDFLLHVVEEKSSIAATSRATGQSPASVRRGYQPESIYRECGL
jgi:hypothetical protein